MTDGSDTTHPAATPPPPPAYIPPPVYIAAPPAKPRGRWLRKILLLLLILSVLLNIVLIGKSAGGLSRQFESTVISEGATNQQVAVYDISGVIDEDQARRFQNFVRHIKDDGDVKAIVLRVNSPGGGVSSSDEMHKNVQDLLATGRPVVVSMGDVAASGGYYLSTPASRIYAEPTTITGSIGVIAFFPILKGTLDKIGVEVVTITSKQAADWKDALSPFREVQTKDVEYMQGILNKLQVRFNQVVEEGRQKVLSKEDVLKLADGRVWLGPEAVENHLADKVGYLPDAIAGAAELAGLKNPRAVQYRRRSGLFEQLDAKAPGIHIDSKLIDDVQTPKLMMIWKMQ